MSDEIVSQKLNDIMVELLELGLPFVLTAQLDDQTYHTTAKLTESSGDLLRCLLEICQACAAADEQTVCTAPNESMTH